jgi:hypothetical protein
MRRDGFNTALASALLLRDVPDLRPDEGTAAGCFTAERLAAAPTPLVAIMAVIATVMRVQVRVVDRTPFAHLEARRQRMWIDRWSRSRVLLATDYVDAVRGLALAWVYEERLT